jgi:Ras-related C3 botulinum toxin substrate 1
MADDSLVKFLSSTDWTKYINDREVKQHAESLRSRVSALGNESKPAGAGAKADDESDIDIAGATRVKLVVVGDGAVGKTSLLISYATNNFPTDYVPTVFENYTARKKRGEETILLHLWDTAGQEEYDRLRPLSYPGADVVLLCFSTVSQASYDAIRDKWAPEVNHYIHEVPHLLVGTKIDLREAQHPDPNSGKFEPITLEAGQAMAKQIKAAKYLEVSSKTRQGLEEVFAQAIDLVLEMRGISSNKGEGEAKSPAVKPAAKKKNCMIL